MKKLSTLLILTTLCSCGSSNGVNLTIIAPEGTPSLCLANYYEENKNSYSSFEIKAGSDPLISAFTKKEKDVIVAPTNLGAKFYNTHQEYVLYKTIVWGNLYLTSKAEIQSLTDLSNKTVTYFGGTSATPYIVLKSLIELNQVENVTLENVDDVATANSLLMTNKAQIVVSAQPSLTKLQQTATEKGFELYTLDLQEEWKKCTGATSYPQASIFVKKSRIKEIEPELNKMVESVKKTVSDPVESSKNAVMMNKTFKNLGETVLSNAIPHSHFEIIEQEKEAIEFYFNKMASLGLAKAYGEKLPDEEFYYTK